MHASKLPLTVCFWAAYLMATHANGIAALQLHRLREQHLQSYLDAFAFRFNRRRTRHAAFRSLLAIAVAKTPATYNILIKPEATA